MDDVIVRQATADDVPELAELRRAFTNEDPPEGGPRADFDEAFRATVSDGLRDGTWVVWVAEVEGQIAAHAFIAVVPKIPRPVQGFRHIGYLTNVYARPEYRNRGIGGRVLTATTEWARRHGIEVLVVWPSEESVSLYRRHGFDSPDEPLVWSNPGAK